MEKKYISIWKFLQLIIDCYNFYDDWQADLNSAQLKMNIRQIRKIFEFEKQDYLMRKSISIVLVLKQIQEIGSSTNAFSQILKLCGDTNLEAKRLYQRKINFQANQIKNIQKLIENFTEKWIFNNDYKYQIKRAVIWQNQQGIVIRYLSLFIRYLNKQIKIPINDFQTSINFLQIYNIQPFIQIAH